MSASRHGFTRIDQRSTLRRYSDVESKPELPQVMPYADSVHTASETEYIPWRVDNEAKAILDDDASH